MEIRDESQEDVVDPRLVVQNPPDQGKGIRRSWMLHSCQSTIHQCSRSVVNLMDQFKRRPGEELTTPLAGLKKELN